MLLGIDVGGTKIADGSVRDIGTFLRGHVTTAHAEWPSAQVIATIQESCVAFGAQSRSFDVIGDSVGSPATPPGTGRSPGSNLPAWRGSGRPGPSRCRRSRPPASGSPRDSITRRRNIGHSPVCDMLSTEGRIVHRRRPRSLKLIAVLLESTPDAMRELSRCKW